MSDNILQYPTVTMRTRWITTLALVLLPAVVLAQDTAEQVTLTTTKPARRIVDATPPLGPLFFLKAGTYEVGDS